MLISFHHALKKRRFIVLIISFWAIVFLGAFFSQHGQAEADIDSSAPNIATQFSQFKPHADPLAFRLDIGDDQYDWTTFGYCKHYQGLARKTYPDGSTYFFITRSGVHTGSCLGSSDNPGEFLVVAMESRDQDGERMRSNRLQKSISLNDALPPTVDKVVFSEHFDGVYTDAGGSTWPPYMHPGDVALVGDVLVVALEEYCQVPFDGTPDSDCDDHDGSNDPDYLKEGGIALVDISNPLAPELINWFKLYSNQDHGLGTIAVTFVEPGEHLQAGADGRYLFAFSYDDSTLTSFAWSDTNDLHTTTSINMDVVWPKVFLGGNLDRWRNWQGLTFLRDSVVQDNGFSRLFLITSAGGSNEPVIDGDDWLGLFQFDLTNLNVAGLPSLVQYVDDMEIDLDHPDMGNYQAAGSAYVSPTGQLIYYSIDHKREEKSDVKMVEMGEVRNYDVHTTQPVDDATCSGWVELYDDTYGWDHVNRSLMFDTRDQGLENWNDLDDYDDGFGDNAESVRWKLPPGTTVKLYENQNYSGDFRTLTGTGSYASSWDFSNKIHSVQMSPIAYTGGPYTFDEDEMGTLDRANPCYLNGGAVIGWQHNSVDCYISFPSSAQSIIHCSDNGEVNVILRVDSAMASTTIYVNNIAPSATFNAPEQTNSYSSFNLSLTNPSDPSPNDHSAGYQYRFDCGGGEGFTSWTSTNSYECSPAGVISSMAVKGEIKDKDEGVRTYTSQVILIGNRLFLPVVVR